MSSTLYLLRQEPNNISPALFHVNDPNEGREILFLEKPGSLSPSAVEVGVVTDGGIAIKRSGTTLTYDDLVEKIFSTEHVIVL